MRPGGLSARREPVRPIAASLRRAAAAGLSFRPEDAGDLPFLKALYASTRSDEMAAVPWPDAEKAAFLDMQFQAQHRHYRAHYPDAEWLIILIGGEPAGRLYVESWPSEIRIIDIALAPTRRRRGFGAAIIADVLDAAARDGLGVGIHVEAGNPAMGLYRRLGFRCAEDKGVYHLMRWQPPAGGASPRGGAAATSGDSAAGRRGAQVKTAS